MRFLSLVTLIFDLDIQTRLSEGPNTSSCEFVATRSAVPEIFDSQTNKQRNKKTYTDGAKNRSFLVCSKQSTVA